MSLSQSNYSQVLDHAHRYSIGKGVMVHPSYPSYAAGGAIFLICRHRSAHTASVTQVTALQRSENLTLLTFLFSLLNCFK